MLKYFNFNQIYIFQSFCSFYLISNLFFFHLCSGTCCTWVWRWPGIRGKSSPASRWWLFGTRALQLWPSSSPASNWWWTPACGCSYVPSALWILFFNMNSQERLTKMISGQRILKKSQHWRVIQKLNFCQPQWADSEWSLPPSYS